MKEQPELTIKLTIDASEALETLANVKENLEQIVGLQGKIAEQKVQVSVRQVTINPIRIELPKEFSVDEFIAKLEKNLLSGLQTGSIQGN